MQRFDPGVNAVITGDTIANITQRRLSAPIHDNTIEGRKRGGGNNAIALLRIFKRMLTPGALYTGAWIK
eukprot:10987240-Heterocapsa_arctica.AAC.1